MYKVKDFIYSDRWVKTAEGDVIKFANQVADVPDKFIGLFKNSDFQIMTHVEDAKKTVVEKIVSVKNDIEKKVEAHKAGK